MKAHDHSKCGTECPDYPNSIPVDYRPIPRTVYVLVAVLVVLAVATVVTGRL